MIKIYLSLFIPLAIYAQKEDYNWLLGYKLVGTSSDSAISVCHLNFENESLTMKRNNAPIFYSQTNTLISNRTGEKILVASNGFQVYNTSLQKIMPDYRINLGAFQSSDDFGMLVYQSAIILETPGSESEYRIFYLWQDTPKPDSFVQMNRFYQGVIDLTKNNGLGELITKDQLILAAPFEYGKLTACKHANGRDWWIVIPKRYSKDIFIFLFDPSGIRLYNTQTFNTITHTGIGGASFSPDGEFYAIAHTDGNDPISRGYIEVYNFDRCEGILSNKRELFHLDTNIIHGVTFSENSRYLYYTSSLIAYRLDIERNDLVASRFNIDTFNGTRDPYQCFFGPCKLAPDGRIYIVSSSGSRCVSVINYPDEDDLYKIGFEQNGLRLPVYNFRTIPNTPHFRLGPIDGSICDSLGINNVPLCRWRADRDTLNHAAFRFIDLSSFEPTSWHWDFGDGTTSETRHPDHVYTKPGIYHVCLTVSNVNGSDKKCKDIGITVVDNQNPAKLKDYFNVYPNPATDQLHLKIELQNQSSVYFVIHDIHGNQMTKYPLSHHQTKYTFDIQKLPSGIYIYDIQSSEGMLRNGKIVKLE